MSGMTLDDVLNGEEIQDEPEAEAESSDDEVTEGEQAESTEAEKQDDEAEKDDSTPESKDDEEPKEWTKQMALDERRKRQERDQRIEELEAKLKQLSGDSANETPKADFYDDPDKALGEAKNEMQSQMQAMKLEMSEELMRSLHDDYDELRSEFIDLARENPIIRDEFNKASNMAKFAYETAKKAREAAELKNPEALREKLRAELRAELEAELSAKAEAEQAKSKEKESALMPSLASAQSKGSIDDAAIESLDDILK